MPWRFPIPAFLLLGLIGAWTLPTVAKADYPHDGPLAVTDTAGVSFPYPIAGRHAQGVYFTVHMDITNNADSPRTYWADYQRLRDQAGREYAPDLRASAAEVDRDNVKIDINPGNHGIAILVFDMPAGASPIDYLLVFHASSDSPGVAIKVNWKS